MSPDEKYVMTYAPFGDKAYTVWNFEMVEIIREFDAEADEDEFTYKWSQDGKYIAKKFRTETIVDDKVTKVKEGLSVYTLPSMQLLANDEGQKKSITIAGITEWMWVPNKNFIVYSAFFPQEEDAQKVDPKIGFLKIPERRIVNQKVIKDSDVLTMYMHPQGFYLGVVNHYKVKKTQHHSVEIFDLTSNSYDTIAHQQIFIKREITDFHSLIWEPNHHHLAIHSNSKREAEAGK